MFTNQPLVARAYSFPSGEQKIVLTEAALETFARYRQQNCSPEAGGLLLAEFDLPNIRTVEATAPNRTDKRSQASFIPDRKAQRRIIQDRFKQNRHLVGEWHTHPEPNPKPSSIDYKSMADSFRESMHELNCFLMIIVGNSNKSLNLWISAHTDSEVCQLVEKQDANGELPS